MPFAFKLTFYYSILSAFMTVMSALLLAVAVNFLNIGADISEQTVQTQIRLLPEEQSDQGLHCLSLHLPLLDALHHY